MPMDFKKGLGALKKVENGAWKVLKPVGDWSNKTAGRFGAESFYPVELDVECRKAARILRTFTAKGAAADDHSPNPAATDPSEKYDDRKKQKVIKKISPKILAEAKGLAIFTVFRTGFGVSGASGSGVVISRNADGSWGGPSGILIHTISVGWLIGADIYDCVLVLRTQKAVDSFRKAKVTLGGEFSVAAGPVGTGVQLAAGVEAAPCWTYVKSKGLYAGLALDGNIIVHRGDANGRFYGREGIAAAEILSGTVKAPAGALPLLQTLYAAEGRPDVLGTDAIPDDPTLADQGVSVADLQQQDQRQQQGGWGQQGLAPEPGQSNDAQQQQQQQQQQHYMAPLPGGPIASQSASRFPPPLQQHVPAPLPSQTEQQHKAALASSGPAAEVHEPAPPSYDGTGAASTSAFAPSTTSESAAAIAAASLPEKTRTVTALFDFEGKEVGDLSFRKGDVIQVVEKVDEQWTRGKLGDRAGIFPNNYAQ